MDDDDATLCEVCGRPTLYGSRHHQCGADLMAVDALLSRVSKTSRAWRKRNYLYEALKYFRTYGDRHSQVWVLLLWWCCDTEVEGYGLYAPPQSSAGARGVREVDGWRLTESEVTMCHSLAVLAQKHDGTDPSFTTLLHREIEKAIGAKLAAGVPVVSASIPKQPLIAWLRKVMENTANSREERDAAGVLLRGLDADGVQPSSPDQSKGGA